MKSILFVAFIFSILFSCKSKRMQDEHPQQAVPEALQNDHGISKGFFSKSRGGNDLVTDLYNDFLKDQPSLKAIENSIEAVDDSAPDSTSSFDQFNEKNKAYYHAADMFTANMKDSLLRDKLKELVQKSLANYDQKISGHNNLLKMIDDRQASLNDLHIMLKLVKTLPLVEKYQSENIPAQKPMEGLVKKYDAIIFSVDSLTKK